MRRDKTPGWGGSRLRRRKAMKRFLPVVIAALMIPSVALAKPPASKGTHSNKGKAKVQYVLKGTLSAYSGFDSSTNTPGSITIVVNTASCLGCARWRLGRRSALRNPGNANVELTLISPGERALA